MYSECWYDHQKMALGLDRARLEHIQRIRVARRWIAWVTFGTILRSYKNVVTYNIKLKENRISASQFHVLSSLYRFHYDYPYALYRLNSGKFCQFIPEHIEFFFFQFSVIERNHNRAQLPVSKLSEFSPPNRSRSVSNRRI